MLNLHKPLCFFDLETTGTNIGKDRIVEISILKVFPDGQKESLTQRINPGIHIPDFVSEIHGIYDKDVADMPTFKEFAPKILEMLEGSDLAGYNSNRFDVPLLAEELMRNGYEFDADKYRLIDVQVIFFKQEPRDLTAAYKFYCDKTLEDAHSAEADVEATYEVFKAQIEKYKELENDMRFLSEFTRQQKFADLAGFIGYDKQGDEIFTFGKYKGKKVKEILEKDSGYYGWIQNADFPLYTKKVLTRLQLQNSKLS